MKVLRSLALAGLLASVPSCATPGSPPSSGDRSGLGDKVEDPAKLYARKREACVKSLAETVKDRDAIADSVRHADRD